MTDRELLEMAAKAAGYSGVWIKWPGARHPLDVELGFFHGSDGSVWNPLTSDGDALRLAVKLGLVVCMMKDAGLTGVYIPAEHIGGKYDAGETYYLTDPCAATRRAIVRAAAGIGRSMP